MIEAGSVIGGRYRLDHVLGEGGMGAVWAATHTLTHKRVAIKLLKAEIASADTLRRFVREARAASAVRHPNVVQVHDILSLDDGSPAMVMDFLEGETLGQFLARSGPIALTELAAIMAPVVSAVGSAHAAGIIHRDLKPDNIFLARLGDGRTESMVLDFGIAKVMPFSEEMSGASALTHSGAVLGTPYYMAPEQAFGEKDVDARVDVWALGVILYECSSGRKPIDGETLGQVFKAITAGKTTPLQEVAPHLPPDFVTLVDGMMQRDREKRIADLREPFERLRGWSGTSVRAFGAVLSIPPPASVPFDATERASVRPGAPASGPVVSAAQGLGASAVPVTKGVGAVRKSALTPVVLGGGLLGALGLAAVVAALLREPTRAADTAASGSSLASTALSLSASTAPSAVPAPPTSASASGAVASASASAAPQKSRAGTAKSSAPGASPRRKLLPGGVDESVPF
jgi:serine/threonine-protein kinase